MRVESPRGTVLHDYFHALIPIGADDLADRFQRLLENRFLEAPLNPDAADVDADQLLNELSKVSPLISFRFSLLTMCSQS
jgi:hypothetical protein